MAKVASAALSQLQRSPSGNLTAAQVHKLTQSRVPMLSIGLRGGSAGSAKPTVSSFDDEELNSIGLDSPCKYQRAKLRCRVLFGLKGQDMVEHQKNLKNMIAMATTANPELVEDMQRWVGLSTYSAQFE